MDIFTLKYFKSWSHFPSWYSKHLKFLIIIKKIAHKKYEISNDHNNYLYFANLRSKIKIESKLSYSNYLLHIQSTLKTNPKHFWDFVKSRKNENNIPQTVYLNDTSVNKGGDISNFLLHSSN